MELSFLTKSNPMTIITPMKPWTVWFTRILLWLLKRVAKFKRAKTLKFIHFAGWQVVGKNQFPHLSIDQPAEKLSKNYFVFSTNFNGPWDQYIEAFSLIPGVNFGLNMLWMTSQGFPSCWPIRPFKRYIHYYDFPVDGYYDAYPKYTVRDIEAALHIRAAYKSFSKKTAQEPDPVAFAKAYEEFATNIIPRIGTKQSATTVLSMSNARPMQVLQ